MKSAEFLRLQELLSNTFCLNVYQSEFLTILLINGESKTKDITKRIEMPRSRMYDIAEKLQEKGFIKISKREKLQKTNNHSKFHKNYVEPSFTKYTPLTLNEITINQKKQMQSQLNEKFKVMDTFKEDIQKQIKTLKTGATQ